jgi:hypothetical protein
VSLRLQSQFVRRVLTEVPKSVKVTEHVQKSAFLHSFALLGILANIEGRKQVMTGNIDFLSSIFPFALQNPV